MLKVPDNIDLENLNKFITGMGQHGIPHRPPDSHTTLKTLIIQCRLSSAASKVRKCNRICFLVR